MFIIIIVDMAIITTTIIITTTTIITLKNPLILIIPNEINELRSYCVQDVTC